MTATLIPEAPTPYDPGNWGEIVDAKTIERTHVPTQGPESWRPLPHKWAIDTIEAEFRAAGFEHSEGLHYRARSRGNEKIKDLPEHGRFLSMYGLKHHNLPAIPGMRWEAGLMNSYDMTKSLQGFLGNRINVCSNGMVMGATDQFKRKHTKGIDVDREGHFEQIRKLIRNVVGSLIPKAEAQVHRFDMFKDIECSNKQARDIIIEAAKKDVIGAAAVMRVLKHWEEPEHPEFKDRNLWSLFNAFTSNDRGRNIMTQADRFSHLDDIIDDRFSISDGPSATTALVTGGDF